MNIGANIKNYRKKQNLTQKELAIIVDVTDATINRYEQGQREPNIETLNKIADALNVSVSELISDEHTMNISEMSNDDLNFLYDTELVELAEIFKKLGYELKENNSTINILKDDKGIASIPEKDFIELGKQSIKHINEFSEFQINKLLEAYEFLS